jgi:hypothetical protein
LRCLFGVVVPYVLECSDEMLALDEAIAIRAAVVKKTEGVGASAKLVGPPHAGRGLQRG